MGGIHGYWRPSTDNLKSPPPHGPSPHQAMSDVRRLQSKLKRGERKTRSAQAPREKTEIGEPKWNTDRTRQPLKLSRGAGRATFESPLSCVVTLKRLTVTPTTLRHRSSHTPLTPPTRRCTCPVHRDRAWWISQQVNVIVDLTSDRTCARHFSPWPRAKFSSAAQPRGEEALRAAQSCCFAQTIEEMIKLVLCEPMRMPA